MVRDPVAVNELPAPAMNCEEARDWFSSLLGGRIALTERALVEAHLTQCRECRQQEARLHRLAARRGPVNQLRPALASLGKAMEVLRITIAQFTVLIARLCALPTIGYELTARTVAGATRAIGLGIARVVEGINLSAWLMLSLRLSVRTVANAFEALRLGIGRVVAGVMHLRAWVMVPFRLFIPAVANVFETLRLGIARVVAGIMHLRAWLMIPRRLSVRAVTNAFEAFRLGITRSVKRSARRPVLSAIPFRPTVRAAGAVLALAFALYALQQSDGPEPYAHPAAPPGPELEPTPLESTRIVPLPPAPSVEQRSIPPAPSRIDDRRQSASQVSTVSSLRVPASEAARGAFLSPAPVRGPMVPATHVIRRLSTKDPSAAERDFTALPADVGGTELSRRDRVRFTAVEVVVPQSRYGEFAHGLARLGSRELEATRLPLADAVHMTIRVSE